MKQWIVDKFYPFPRFGWVALPAVTIGLIAAGFMIVDLFNFDQSKTSRVVISSVSLVCAIISLSGLVLLRMYAEMERARIIARTDDLTGLINRREFNRILNVEFEKCQSQNSTIALLALDLDHFKTINDSYGHQVGDAVIRQFGQRIKDTLRDSDVVCRISGDEFFVLLRKVKDGTRIQNICKRMLSALEEPFKYEEHYVNASVSIGSALIGPEVTDASTAMKMADFALLECKKKGRNGLVEFKPEMAQKIENQSKLASDVVAAIRSKSVYTRYLPIVSHATNAITGVEVVATWKDEQGNRMSSTDFQSLAYEVNSIGNFGLIIFEKACEEIKHLENLRMTINIGHRQFLQDNFVQSIRQVLIRTGFPPNRLELEMPQAILAMDSTSTVDKLDELRTMGITIALDDFGIGYSNMLSLHKCKLDRIKLDSSFMSRSFQENGGYDIIESMIALSRSVSNGVTIQGVSSNGQFDVLRKMNCDEYQGSYFSAPLTVLELTDVTSNNNFAHRLETINRLNRNNPVARLSA